MSIDVLQVRSGMVVAPAGCGKTELITTALKAHAAAKPVLILTHTNAGVAALRGRLGRLGVKPASYRLATIDGWAIRLITTFPLRSGHDPSIVQGSRPDYISIRRTAARLLASGHVGEIVAASYSNLLVDEYQDCSVLQHLIVSWLSMLLPTCTVGDPMQAIFGFDPRDGLAPWHEVESRCPCLATLAEPWRWKRLGADELGHWLLHCRDELLAGRQIDLRTAPPAVQWISLDGSAADHQKRLAAGRTNPRSRDGTVLIIGDSRRPADQQRFASQTPGAVTVEAVDLRDLVTFAESFDLQASDAVHSILEFAKSLMTDVNGPDLLRRLDCLRRGTARNAASDVEAAALAFEGDRCHGKVADLLVEINRQSGVRVFRPAVFRACMQALQQCASDQDFAQAAVRMREQYRLLGRALPRRAVGSTLLLKGLEADVAVLLNADELDSRNLYVAMTRGSQQLVVCARNPLLGR